MYAYDVTAFGRRATAVSVLLRLTLSPSFPCHDYYDFFERVNDTLCTVQTHSLHTFYFEVVDSFVALSRENSSFVSFVQTAKLLYVIPVAVFCFRKLKDIYFLCCKKISVTVVNNAVYCCCVLSTQ